jgi:hypothetical protein
MAQSSYDKLKHAIRYWLLRHLPTCEATVQTISQSMERPLTLRERALMKIHLWICAWCQWYLEQLHLIRKAARSKAEEAPEVIASSLSDEARERIRRNLTHP